MTEIISVRFKDGGKSYYFNPNGMTVAVGDRVMVLVDGGIRTGLDVFKALALGADGVLIGRPFVTMVYGGGEEGVAAYVRKLTDELSDTMAMCGAHSLKEINREMLWQG